MDLIIATRNSGKLAEFQALFSDAGVRCISAGILPEAPEIEEDAITFAGNAIKKAVLTALAVRAWCLSDDSGLEVDALDNAPGVRSARYAGEPPNDAANNQKLLRALQGITDRAAHFRCVLALSSPAGHAQIVEGACAGRIALQPRGSEGFGYDPLFIPDGYEQTMAELGATVKNRISHRATALRLAFEQWNDVLRQQPDSWPSRRPLYNVEQSSDG